MTQTAEQATGGALIPLTLAFLDKAIETMIPWLIVMLAVITTDLISGVWKSMQLDVKVHPSRALKETIGKIVVYSAFVCMISCIAVAMGDVAYAKWSALLVIAIEAGSVIGNILEPHGIDFSVKAFIKMIFRRSPLNLSEEEAAELITKESKIETLREEENLKWNNKAK